MPRYEDFSDRARKVMALANQEAQRFNHEYIGTEHILLGLVKEGSGIGANVLKDLDVNLRKVRVEVERLVKSGPDMVTMGNLPLTPRGKKVVELAREEARLINNNTVETGELLLGLMREFDGVAALVLKNFGLKVEEVKEEILNLRSAGISPESGPPAMPVDPAKIMRAMPIAVVGDSTILSRDEYAELITLLGDIVRAHGGKGVERIWESESELPVDAKVPA